MLFRSAEIEELGAQEAERKEFCPNCEAETPCTHEAELFVRSEERRVGKDDVYSAMFECSHVDGVRLFPYIEENGQKYFLVMLREDE